MPKILRILLLFLLSFSYSFSAWNGSCGIGAGIWTGQIDVHFTPPDPKGTDLNEVSVLHIDNYYVRIGNDIYRSQRQGYSGYLIEIKEPYTVVQKTSGEYFLAQKTETEYFWYNYYSASRKSSYYFSNFTYSELSRALTCSNAPSDITINDFEYKKVKNLEARFPLEKVATCNGTVFNPKTEKCEPCGENEQLNENTGKCAAFCYDESRGIFGTLGDDGLCSFCSVGTYPTSDRGDANCVTNCELIQSKYNRFSCLCERSGKGKFVSNTISMQSAISVSNTGNNNGSSGYGYEYFGGIQCELGSILASDIKKGIEDSEKNKNPDNYIQNSFNRMDDFMRKRSEYEEFVSTSNDSSGGTLDNEQSSESKTATFVDPKTGKVTKAEVSQNKDDPNKYDITFSDGSKTSATVDKGSNKITYRDKDGKTIEIPNVTDKTNRIEFTDENGNKVIMDMPKGNSQKPDLEIEITDKDDGGGSGTGDNDGTQGKGNEDGKCEGDDCGICLGDACSFEGESIGNKEAFDKALAAEGLAGEALSQRGELGGLVSGLFDDVKQTLDNSKKSIDNIIDSAKSLSENPFNNSSKVSSCPISFTIIEGKPQKVDPCEYLSKFRDLFYLVFFSFINIFIAIGAIKLLIMLFAAV